MTGTEDPPARPDAHLRDIADGCGCAEVWEHTSAAREEDAERTEDAGRGVDEVENEDGGRDVDASGGERRVADGTENEDGAPSVDRDAD